MRFPSSSIWAFLSFLSVKLICYIACNKHCSKYTLDLACIFTTLQLPPLYTFYFRVFFFFFEKKIVFKISNILCTFQCFFLYNINTKIMFNQLNHLTMPYLSSLLLIKHFPSLLKLINFSYSLIFQFLPTHFFLLILYKTKKRKKEHFLLRHKKNSFNFVWSLILKEKGGGWLVVGKGVCSLMSKWWMDVLMLSKLMFCISLFI